MAFCKILPVLRTAAHRLPFKLPPSRSYWGRRHVFSELSSALQTMDRRMRDMDRELCRVMEEMEKSSPFRFPRVFAPWAWDRIRDVPVEKTTKDGRKYQLELDMPDMLPEDISVTLKDHTLKISARKEEKKSDGSRCVRNYTYEYSLPREVNPENVRSLFMDGVLTVEAPLPALEEQSEEPKEIPIQMDTDDKKNSAP